MSLTVSVKEIVDGENDPVLGIHPTWDRVPLGDIADVINGFPFDSNRFSLTDGRPLVRIRDVLRGMTETFTAEEVGPTYDVEAGDLLIGMDGDFNCARWIGPPSVLNQRVCKVEVTSTHYEPKFLDYALPGYLRAINRHTSSVTVKHLSSRSVQQIPLPLPPLNEQRRIVAKLEELLSELDAGVESLKTAREQLNVYRQALLKHAFEGKLTAAWRAENADKLESTDELLERIRFEREEHHRRQMAEWEGAVRHWQMTGAAGRRPARPSRPKDLPPLTAAELAELPDLPDGWAWHRLGGTIDEPRYGTAKKCEYNVEGCGVLRIPNIGDGVVDSSDLKYALFERAEIDAHQLFAGDILMIRSNGSVSLVGKSAMITSRDVHHLYAGYLIRVRPNPQVLRSTFLLKMLSYPETRRQIEAKAKSTSGVHNLNSGEIQSLVVPICGVAEQEQVCRLIAEALSEAARLDRELAVNITRAAALRESILKRAFSGQLVPQDPSDEPASVLLERIRAENGAAGTGTPARRARRGRKHVN